MDNVSNTNSGIRLLASIMFTDIVGYTALMQENEIRAKNMIDRHRGVLERIIPSYKGRVLQFYGDGTLSIFGSVIESIECALEIQKELMTEPHVPLRIGIHVGDIIYGDDSIYGDGVNIAARIQSKGVPGSILFSDKVHDEIKNHPFFTSRYIGLHELKNVKKPIKIYALENEPLEVPDMNTSVISNEQKNRTLAVLPFINMSADSENEYFSDGITEEIINSLANVNNLNITSRTSSFAFKGKNLDIRKIGSDLNVNYILEGSVRKAGDKVRITAQLINSADGYHLWSETFNRHLKDIFEVQDEISNTIASKLREKLSIGEKSLCACEKPVDNLEAYNLYLKGLFYWNKWTPYNVKTAIDYFKQSLDLEPNYHKTLAAIANCYIFLGAMGFMKPSIAYPESYKYTERAMKADPNYAEAYISSALTKLFYEYDVEGCRKDFEKGLELKPGSGGLHHTYTFYFNAIGKVEEGLKKLEYAAKLDPLNIPINEMLGWQLSMNHRYKEALLQYERVIEMDPTYISAILGKAMVYAEMGEFDKALDFLDKQPKTNHIVKGPTYRGCIYAMKGDAINAVKYVKMIDDMEVLHPDVCLSYDKSFIYALLGDIENTYINLNKAIEERAGGMVFVYHNPMYRKVIKDERILKLLKQNKLIN